MELAKQILIILSVWFALAFIFSILWGLAVRALGNEEESEQVEYLNEYSFAERARRDMRAMRGGK